MALTLGGCTRKAPPAGELRVLLESPPSTLNPRATLDAVGQRINALIFSGLTAINADLQAVPDLASAWKTERGGLTYRFTLRDGAVDQDGRPITADDLAICVNEYMSGTPTSPLQGSFPQWKSVRAEKNEVVVELKAPDPFLPRNVTLLRFFRVEGVAIPCRDPEAGQRVIGSALYRAMPFDLNPEKELLLRAPGRPDLRFLFVRDETTRTLKLLKGEADVAQNSFSLTKTRWIEREHGDRFTVLVREGVPVSYLGFNLKDPILGKRDVRRAIAHGIDRESIVRHKLMGFGTIAGSFLAPGVRGAHSSPLAFDPILSEKLLDQAGFPRQRDGIRFAIRYKTTPVRDGIETALLFKDMLAKVGIRLDLEMVEPAVFLASIRKGAFQMYSSRWVGISDGSIFHRTLRSGEKDNRVRYADADMDRWIDLAMTTPEEKTRDEALVAIQKKMAEDLPYFPLWFWKSALILRKPIIGLSSEQISLSGALGPLGQLRDPSSSAVPSEKSSP